MPKLALFRNFHDCARRLVLLHLLGHRDKDDADVVRLARGVKGFASRTPRWTN